MTPVQGSNNLGVVNRQLLDEIVMKTYAAPFDDPYMASVRDEMVMRQKSTDTGAHTTANFKGPGLFEARGESQKVKEDSIETAQYKTTVINTFAEDVPLSMEYFEDEKFDTVAELLRQLGEMARVTSEIKGMSIYRDNLATNSGTSLLSASHTTISGDTVDNLMAGALTPDTLNEGITSLNEQPNQAGVVVPRMPKCLLVTSLGFKNAVEIADSQLLANTADNNINVILSRYGITVKRSPYLGPQFGGNNDNWWLLGQFHTVSRIDRRGLVTDIVEPKFTDGLNYVYRANYRENFTVDSYENVVGYHTA